MTSLRIGIALLCATLNTSQLAGNNAAQMLAAHPVWILEDLKWEQDPGDKQQSWASATVLYFGEHGKFGRFGGVLIKRGKKLGLSEGEGEIVYSGTWKVSAGIVQTDYRLVGMYKVVPLTREGAPEIPGPVQHAELRIDSKSPAHVEFDGKRYQTTSRLGASELKERLQFYESTEGSKHSAPN